MFRILTLGLVLGLSFAGEAQCLTITKDLGGKIDAYVDKYKSLYNSGERIIIDGKCASACTLALGIIPRSRLCATRRAAFGFHQAWDALASWDNKVVMVADKQASEYLMSHYPEPIRRWIYQRGGLPPPNQLLWLRGRALARLVPPCRRRPRLLLPLNILPPQYRITAK